MQRSATAVWKGSLKIPGASRETFEKVANAAKAGCPVSNMLNAQITIDAALDS